MLRRLRILSSTTTNTLNATRTYLRTMSAKTVAVLDDSELKDGQMKEVTFEEGKVLVSRLGTSIHATSAFCTHYGAPLAKGVLTSDGRVVCPWHGACFNVCTGDIEDAPAPAALHSFKAYAKDGKIYVEADPKKTVKDQMSRQPKLVVEGKAEGRKEDVVIVGGGSATFHAIEGMRESGYDGLITVLTKEPYMPIDRTKLSKALITDPAKIELRNAADYKIKYGVTFRTSVNVNKVDSKSKKVHFTTLSGSSPESYPYTHLILASGGTPRRLPVPGHDAPNVYTFRTISDAKTVDSEAQEGKNCVVIGSSFISMELAFAMAGRKLGSITVVGMDKVPFEGPLGPDVGKIIQGIAEGKGIKFKMGEKLEKISVDEEGKATGVVVAGEEISADFIIMGTGVAPATEFLKESGFELEKDGGVKVDEYLKVNGLKDVFAVGDIAHYPVVGGGSSRIEHWNVAGNHGRAVGATIAGKGKPFEKIPIFWSAQGQQLRYCGIGSSYDDVILQKTGDTAFAAFYAKAGKIVAVATMGRDPIVSKSSELMRLGLMPSAAAIKDGADVLKVDVSSVASKDVVAA